MGIRSSDPIYVEWTKSSTNASDFTFKVNYKFADDNICGVHTGDKLEGGVRFGIPPSAAHALNQYYHQKCKWILHSPTNQLLTLEIDSTQDREYCNVTLLVWDWANDIVAKCPF